ncbi:MAG: molybdopterin-dependent oxidoreductase [Myxococcales bacterium]|nr:molybdopterin-dependent oxidoreductase [Myxococcales bacterium]
MQRRDILKLAGTTAFGSVLAGCDRLVVLEERENPELDPVTSTEDHYKYSVRAVPEYDSEVHETPILYQDVELGRFDLSFLRTLPAMDKEHTLECIGSKPSVQRIGNAVWSGLPLIDVLDEMGVVVPEAAVGLRLWGMDNYHAGVPISDLLEAPIWLMWRMNGEELTMEHGAPARLLVPDKYGVKCLKWLEHIAFVDEPHESFWTPRGWSEEARFLPNTLIVHPLDGVVVSRDEPVRIIGTAFAGEDPVVAVDVRIDGGDWQPATMEYGPGAAIWVLWSYEWQAEKGQHTFQVRCTTESGAMSVEAPGGTDPFIGYDGSMQITLSA